jgi:hypothetical protein
MAVSVQFMRRLLYAIGVITLVSLAACGDPTTQQPSAAAPEATVASTTAVASTAAPSTVAVPAALAFTAAQVGGGTINLADYAGKTVLLWFWAPT